MLADKSHTLRPFDVCHRGADFLGESEGNFRGLLVAPGWCRRQEGERPGLTPKLLARQAPDQSGSGKPAPAYLKVAFFQFAYALRNPQ